MQTVGVCNRYLNLWTDKSSFVGIWLCSITMKSKTHWKGEDRNNLFQSELKHLWNSVIFRLSSHPEVLLEQVSTSAAESSRYLSISCFCTVSKKRMGSNEAFFYLHQQWVHKDFLKSCFCPSVWCELNFLCIISVDIFKNLGVYFLYTNEKRNKWKEVKNSFVSPV